MDLEKYYAPISEQFPCGEDLEELDDVEFCELEILVPVPNELDMFKEDDGTDWGNISKKSLLLLKRSKDIRLILYYARARLTQKDLIGFSEAIKWLKNSIMEYWDSIFPLLDGDKKDPVDRLDALKILGNQNAVLNHIKKLSLVESPAFGRFCYRDCEIADGSISVEENDKVDEKRLNAAFMDVKKEVLKNKIHLIETLIDDLKQLDEYLLKAIPGKTPAELKNLIKLFERILNRIVNYANNRKDWLASDQAETSKSIEVDEEHDTKGSRSIGEKEGIGDRSDVIKAIDEICMYYEKNEPSSPVPLLLQRAKRMVNMNFMEIIQDMAEDAMNEITNITGVTEEEN